MKCLIISLIVIFGGLTKLNAQAVLTLSEQTDMDFIGKSITYWIDSSETTALKDILETKVPLFQLGTEEILEFGGCPYPIWIRIQTQASKRWDWVLQSHTLSSTDTLDFFAILPDSQTAQQNIHPLQPLSKRPIRVGHPIFELHPEAEIHYLRVHSSGIWRLALRLASWKHLFEYYHSRDFLQGIFFGILILSGVVALVVRSIIQLRIFFYYALYVVGVLITNGAWENLLFEWFWANFPILNYLEPSKFVFFILVMPFVSSFLNTKKNAPILHCVFYGLVGLYALGVIANLLGLISLAYFLIDTALFLTLIQIIVVSIVVYNLGYEPAKLFLLAWLPFLVGIMITFLQDAGVLPHNTFTFHAIKIGTLWEILVLSWAISLKIKTLRQEREKADQERLRAMQQNEKMIREQNKLLEAKVEKRTAQLAQKNKALQQHEHELKHALHELQAKEAQLVQSEKMTSLGVLTAGIAHELNNPISFINASAYALERCLSEMIILNTHYEEITPENSTKKLAEIDNIKEEMDYEGALDDLRELVQGLKSSAKRTNKIVKALRLFSRLDENSIKYIDLHKNLDSVLTMLTNHWNNRVEIIRQYQEIPKVECFAGKLNQVFMNIILNALQATPDKGKLTIATSQVNTPSQSMVRVAIKDTGKGIPKSVQSHIFEPFYTTKPVGEGTGLGLAISYGIIKEHGGRLSFQSEENIGTEFWIDLPIASTSKTMSAHEPKTQVAGKYPK